MKTHGQASLEMAVAMVGALLLLFGSIKIFMWIGESLISRQQRYDATRGEAASGQPDAAYEPSTRLDIFF